MNFYLTISCPAHVIHLPGLSILINEQSTSNQRAIMDQSQAVSTIQRAWRNRLSRKKHYSSCYFQDCNNIFVTRSHSNQFCESCKEYIDETEEANRNYRRGPGPKPDELLHYCCDYFCSGDCGELSCGCIDVCRGRCGTPRHLRYGW